MRAALSFSPTARTLLLAGEGRLEGLEGSAQLGYDFLAQKPEAQAALLYRLPEGFGLGLLGGYRQGVLSWQALG